MAVMNTNFCLNHLSLAVIVAVFIALSSIGTAFASVQTIEADGYYIIGDGPDENHSVAKKRAKMDAKRSAAEKAGVYVESLTEVKNGQLTKDEINTISAQILQIESEKLTPEIMGETIRYCCHIVAKVDSSYLADKLKQDRQKLREAVEQNKHQQQELDAVKKELADLKERYKTADENHRQEINSAINKNEDRFTSIEWAQKGLDYYYSNNNQKAIDCFQKATQINPNNYSTWSDLGAAYFNLGNYQKGIECQQRAIQINPNFDSAWYNLGTAYGVSGNYQKAIECFQKAVQINFNNDAAWNNLGNAYTFSGNKQKAIEYFQKALQINPNNYAAWNNLGVAYYFLGNKQNAAECFQKALQINPNYADARNNLSKLN